MTRCTQKFYVIIGLLGLLCTPLSSAHAVMVELALSSPTITEGQTFTLDVIAHDVFAGRDPDDLVLAFGFDVAANPPLVSFTSATVAFPPFDDDSAMFADTDVAGSAFPAIPNNGMFDTLLLATLRFTALNAGSLTLGIVSDLLDPNEGLIYALPNPADLTTSLHVTIVPRGPTAIPEPSTVALLGSGLLSLLVFRWRRHVKR